MSAAARPASFAFRSLNGQQCGQVFALEGVKTILQFDGSLDGSPARPTRCLVSVGNDGVWIRIIQGELAVNGRLQKEAWLHANDEISCGPARLRLIELSTASPTRIAAPPEVPAPTCPADPQKQSPTNPHSPDVNASNARIESRAPSLAECLQVAREESCKDGELGFEVSDGSRRFFDRLATDEPRTKSPGDGSTMCLSPDELRSLLEPAVYETDDTDTTETTTNTVGNPSIAGNSSSDTAPIDCETHNVVEACPANGCIAFMPQVACWQTDSNAGSSQLTCLPSVEVSMGVVVH
jgi:hypothetical protein